MFSVLPAPDSPLEIKKFAMWFGSILSKWKKRNSRAQDGLIFSIVEHVSVGFISDGEDVWRNVLALDSLELLSQTVGVNWETTVWVDDDAEQTRVCLEISLPPKIDSLHR